MRCFKSKDSGRLLLALAMLTACGSEEGHPRGSAADGGAADGGATGSGGSNGGASSTEAGGVASTAGGTGGTSSVRAERLATGAVYYFTLRGSQIYWLGFADSFLSIHRSSLDGSGEHTVIDKLPADDYVFEIAATDAHVYYLGGLALHEVTEPGAVVDRTLLDYGYGLLADEQNIFVKLARTGAVRIDANGQHNFPDAEVITLTQDAEYLYWIRGDRAFRQSKVDPKPPEQGPMTGASKINALAVAGSSVYGLTNTGVVQAVFDPAATFMPVPLTGVELAGGAGPIVARSGKLFFVSGAGTTKEVIELPISGGEPVVLYTSDWVAPALAVDSSFVYFADRQDGLYRAPIGR